MKYLGIDPSSSCCGVALVEIPFQLGAKPQLLWTKTWKPDKGASPPENLHGYFLWLRNDALVDKDDTWSVPVASFACVENLSVMQNANSTRLISHYQAASVLACKQLGMAVIEGRVSSARKATLGRGNMSKDEAWEAVKKMYPHHKFRAKTSGGQDETDAVVLALAGRTLTEKR